MSWEAQKCIKIFSDYTPFDQVGGGGVGGGEEGGRGGGGVGERRRVGGEGG